MEFHMRNLLSFRKFRKGQFFILTAVAIVTILFFISRWLGPNTQIDTSAFALSEELFTFDNIREKAVTAAKGSENCDDLTYNLQEFKRFVEEFALEKNYKMTFNFNVQSCSGQFSSLAYQVNADIIILSDKVDARSSFTIS